MRDVARRAAVSITTILDVTNETRFVSEELPQRVYQAIRELDYRPNAIA